MPVVDVLSAVDTVGKIALDLMEKSKAERYDDEKKAYAKDCEQFLEACLSGDHDFCAALFNSLHNAASIAYRDWDRLAGLSVTIDARSLYSIYCKGRHAQMIENLIEIRENI